MTSSAAGLPDFDQPPFAGSPEARFAPAPMDGVMPERFFSTSNLPTYVRVGGRWVMPSRPRMDCVIVRRPGGLEPIDYIMGIGTITKVAMENLMAQMDDIQKSRAGQAIKFTAVEAGQIAVVVVSPGAGLSRIFASLGAAAVVAGGQTMNPSTQDILQAFENLPTDKVIILPNNKNIIMAANQAKEVTVKQVAVVPSRTVPQGLAAMLALQPDGEVDSVSEKMTNALSTVRTGEFTVAVRNVEIDNVSVKEGQVMTSAS